MVMGAPAGVRAFVLFTVFLVSRNGVAFGAANHSVVVERAGGVVLMASHHKSGFRLSAELQRQIAKHSLAQDLGRSVAFKQITGLWEQIDGVVRSPVMVCPKRKAFDEIIPSKAWGANRTSMIQTVRIDLACDDYNPHNFGGELPRVALMYRDPFNQVISSYNYHTQVPTPEKWIRGYTKPLMPSDFSESQAAQEYIANRLRIPNINLTRAAALHANLFTSTHAANYEKALRSLSAEDGLRMEAARYLCVTRSHRGGFGAVLRMAANVVPVRRQFDSELFLMEDWINPDDNVKKASVMRLLSLVCGDGECADVATRAEVAAAIVRKQNPVLTKGGNHITHTSHSLEAHAAQEAVLKADPVLGPLLSYFRCIISDGGVNACDVCCFGAPDGKC